MILRTACLFLFSCSVLTLTGCQGQMANPLDGVNRMIQAVGRTAGRLSAEAKVEPLQLEPSEIERARETLPGNAPQQQTPSGENQVALLR